MKIAFFLTFLYILNSFAAPEIIVQSENLIDSDKVTFGDIAQIKDVPKNILEKIKLIPICDAPASGEVRKLTSFGISEMIRYSFQSEDEQQIFKNIKFKIPKEVSIYQKKFSIHQDTLKKVITAWIEESCAGCEIEIKNLNVPNIEGVSGVARWMLQKNNISPRGHFSVPIQITEKDKDIKKLWINGEVRIHKIVPVLQRSLVVGSRVQAEDIKLEKRDVTYSREVVPTETELASGELSRSLVSSDIIWKTYLKRKLVLQQGQPVNIITRAEGFNVNTKGVSEGFGYVGDMIKVLNPQTNKIIVGVIVDQNTVEVK